MIDSPHTLSFLTWLPVTLSLSLFVCVTLSPQALTE